MKHSRRTSAQMESIAAGSSNAWRGRAPEWFGVSWEECPSRAPSVARDTPPRQADFSFVQISDSHIGFNKPANTDVTATLQAALDRIGASPTTPDFLIHTGDLTHCSKPAEFDTLAQVLTGSRKQVFYVPGEHDTSVDDGKMYLDRYGKGNQGKRLVQLRSQGSALHRAGQRRSTGRHGQARPDATWTGSSRT